MIGRRLTSWRLALAFAAGIVLLALLLVLGASLGPVTVPPGEVARIIARAALGGSPASDLSPAVTAIVLQLRLPRVLLAGIVGAGLAVVGVLLQTTTRNDLADPFVFGLSSGAATGAVAVISFVGDRLGVWTLPIASFAGGLVSSASVVALVLARRSRGEERLIVAGLAVSFLFGAITDVLVFAGDQRASQSILFWMLGGFGLARWDNLPLAGAGLAVALAAGLGWSRRLDALLAGDQTAASLGIHVRRFRVLVFLCCALATSTFVALSGVIGFVGLMIPQLARAMVGLRHQRLVPVSALLGTVLMVSSDLISRVLLVSQELPVGIVTAGLGAVFVLVMLLRGDAGANGRRQSDAPRDLI